MTVFCLLWHFLHTKLDKYRILPYQADIVPWDDTVVASAEQPEELRTSVHDDGDHPCVFGIHFQIIHKSYPASVLCIYHFFLSQF